MRGISSRTVLAAVGALLLLQISLRPVFRHFFTSTESLVANLESSDRDTVLSGYYYLTERVNPIAVDKAIAHLASDDDYIWLNAAHYLGACKHESSVPYLIKALRHTAWRVDEDTVAYLKAITRQDLPNNFGTWKRWWDSAGRDAQIDWESKLGHAPRTTKAEPPR